MEAPPKEQEAEKVEVKQPVEEAKPEIVEEENKETPDESAATTSSSKKNKKKKANKDKD